MSAPRTVAEFVEEIEFHLVASADDDCAAVRQLSLLCRDLMLRMHEIVAGDGYDPDPAGAPQLMAVSA